MKYCVGSLILVAIKATIAVGGLGVVLERNYESGRIEAPMYIRFLCNLTICLCSMLCKFFRWDIDPTIRSSIWSTVIGGKIHTKHIDIVF